MGSMSGNAISGLDYRNGRPVKVTFREGLIYDVHEVSLPVDQCRYIIAPGLVDLQVNGYAGIDLNGSSLKIDDIMHLTVRLWSEGVTSFFPTIITNSEENILQSVRLLAEACHVFPEAGNTIAGIHLEGPFISPDQGPRGAHPADSVRPPDWDLFCRWQDASMGMIKIITLSPEWPGTDDFIRKCVSSGVIVSIGHTSATPESIRSAVEAGATLSTHLGNASHQLLPRHRNYIWEQLAAEDLYITIISDGFHLPDAMMKVFLKVKPDKTILVSDSTNFTGMLPGDYSTHIGGEVTLTDQGKLHIKGRPDVLAGSGLSLLHCVNTLIKKDLTTPGNGWEMASVMPVKFVAPGKSHGLTKGAPADIDILELTPSGYSLNKTIKAGNIVYS